MHTLRSFAACLLLCLIGIIPLVSSEHQVPKLLDSTTSMKTETRYLVYALEQLHYLNRTLQSFSMDHLIELYMKDLDPHKLFFTQPEVLEFQQRFSSVLPVYLRQQGNLSPAFEIFQRYKEHVLERISWVHTRIEQPFNLDAHLSFEPDREKAPWVQSLSELESIWQLRLQYELLNEVLSQNDTDEADTATTEDAASVKPIAPSVDLFDDLDKRLADAKTHLHKRYTRFQETLLDMDASEVQEVFLTSVTHLYDPHSQFLSHDSMEELSMALKNSLVGMGALLSEENGYCTIRELLPNGPAERSQQLKGGDRIVGIGQESGPIVDVIGMRLKNIVKLIRGKQGTTVRLLIQPANSDPSSRILVPLQRDEVKLTAQLARAQVFEIPKDNHTIPIGVIDLPVFYGAAEGDKKENNATHDVAELIDKLKAYNIQGLIIDLRRNSGGFLPEAISLTGLFIPSGPVVQSKDTLDQVSVLRDYTGKMAWDGPLLLLTSRYSASATEILAGALRCYQRALIVGDPNTHGKGTVQGVYDMDRSIFNRFNKPQMGAAKVTIQKWYQPDGSSIQIQGVPADIQLPSINPFLPIAESDLPNPLPWDSIEPVDIQLYQMMPQYKGVSQSLVESLCQRSQDRQRTLPEFAYLRETIAWLKERQDQKTFSLNFQERKTQRLKDIERRQQLEERRRELSKHDYEGKPVYLSVAEDHTLEKKTTKEPGIDIHLQESIRIMMDWIVSSK